MAFITYVILFGYYKGTAGTFNPEVLVGAVWSCLLLQLIEALSIKYIGLNIVGTSVSTNISILDVISYTGYKYVGLCGTIFAYMCGTFIFTVYTLYQALALFYF